MAPVIISTLVYAQAEYAKGNLLALALPFLLGAGMGLPWPFAGAGLAFLPKPGMWMVRVKQAFGVLILGFAVYYGLLAFNLYKDRYFVDKQAVASSAKAMDAGRLAFHARARSGRGREIRQAGSARFLGHLVQELHGHERHHAQGHARH